MTTLFFKIIVGALLLSSTPTINQAIHVDNSPADCVRVFRAAQRGNVSCLKKFLSCGFDISTKNDRGDTPLTQAIASTQIHTEEVINFLLANGADPLQPARDGTTPLRLANYLHRIETTQTIFNAIMRHSSTSFAPSLSMLIADLKLSPDGQVTILELGEGPLSYFKGHDALYSTGLIWQRFWQYLAKKQLPMWYVGDLRHAKQESATISASTFKDLGGIFCKSLHELEATQFFKNTIESAHKHNAPQVGIVLLRHHATNTAMRNYFKKKYPEIILINDPVRQFVSSKFMTNLLFTNDQSLQNFRPECHVYEKEYSPELTATIHATFAAHELIVIKPLNAANGWGVIITTHENLDNELQKILYPTNTLKDSTDPSYSYWATDKNKHFIVEAFVPSKIIRVNNKEYDATMRQVFVIENNASEVNLTFIGSYWKLPANTINSKGSLTALHKSNVKSGNKPSAIVTPDDDAVVQNTLQTVLPRIYTKMLQCAAL